MFMTPAQVEYAKKMIARFLKDVTPADLLAAANGRPNGDALAVGMDEGQVHMAAAAGGDAAAAPLLAGGQQATFPEASTAQVKLATLYANLNWLETDFQAEAADAPDDAATKIARSTYHVNLSLLLRDMALTLLENRAAAHDADADGAFAVDAAEITAARTALTAQLNAAFPEMSKARALFVEPSVTLSCLFATAASAVMMFAPQMLHQTDAGPDLASGVSMTSEGKVAASMALTGSAAASTYAISRQAAAVAGWFKHASHSSMHKAVAAEATVRNVDDVVPAVPTYGAA